MITRHTVGYWACLAIGAAATAMLSGCGGVQIKPEAVLPKPLIEPLPAKVGLVIPEDMRNYAHSETRWGVDWKIDLGAGHARLMRDIFAAEFANVEEFPDLAAAQAASGLKAIFEPRIEQYSFVTARETNGRYYAVTIRYRLNLYTPAGELADSFTLTGYGNALAKGISSSGPLQIASVAAMRDAAAKFLVQFPEQDAGAKLARNEAVEAVKDVAAASANVDASGIEAVPIEEPGSEASAAVPPATPAPPPVSGNPSPQGASPL